MIQIPPLAQGTVSFLTDIAGRLNSDSLAALNPRRFQIAFGLAPKISSLPIHESIGKTMTPTAAAKVFRVCGFTIIERVIQNQAPRFRLQRLLSGRMDMAAT